MSINKLTLGKNITKPFSKTSLVAIFSTILLISTIMAGSNLPTATAAEGDVLQSIFCAGSGVGVAFEGTTVWWPRGFFATTLARCDINSESALPDVPIVGLQGGDRISTLSYDITRNVFWAINGNTQPNHNVYQITLDGTATFQYNINVQTRCCGLVDGIAYDGEDDSLWISPDVNFVITHIDATTGDILNSFDIPRDSGNGCGNSGVAAGTGILYLGFNGCNIIQTHEKSDLSLIDSFVLNGASRVEDLECGVTDQGVEVIWSKDANDIDLIAFEVPEGTCPIGGVDPDSDGDGVLDKDDECPDEFGTLENGCNPSEITEINCEYNDETSVVLNGVLEYSVNGTCDITRGGEVETKNMTLNVEKEILGEIGQAGDSIMYGSATRGSTTPGLIVIVDPDTAAQTPVGVPAESIGIGGLAFDSTGRLFGATLPGGNIGGGGGGGGSSAPSELIEIDPNDGSLIQSFGIITGGTEGPLRINDLAIQPGTDVIYGVTAASQGSNIGQLYTIDISASAIATRVGALNLGNDEMPIAFAPDGTLYMTCFNCVGEGVRNQLLTINPDTGVILTRASLDDIDVIVGLGIRSDNTIFAYKGNNPINSEFPSLLTISTSGVVTEIGFDVEQLHDLTFTPGVTSSPCNDQTGTFTIIFDDESGTIVVNEQGEICQEGSTIEFNGNNTSVQGTGDYEDMGLQCGDVDATVILNNDSASGTVSITQCPVIQKTSNGGMNSWDKRPTFGISHEDRQNQVVENGFSFNNEYFTLTDNHHTDFVEQSVDIGTTNSFSATVYADKKLKVQEFLFGIPNVGEAHLAELGVEVWYDINGEIEDVIVVQNSHVIDADTVSVSHEKVKCLPTDADALCDTTTVSMTFLEPLLDKVMAIKAIDHERRDQRTFLNEGFDISGESLNPMLSNMIPSNVRNEGLLLVTQVAKYSPYWEADDGRIFEMNSFGSFKQINQSFERFQDTGTAYTRMHSGFGGIIAYEQDRALDVFDASEFISELPDSFAYIYPETGQRMTDEMMQVMLLQEEIAKAILDEMDKQNRHY